MTHKLKTLIACMAIGLLAVSCQDDDAPKPGGHTTGMNISSISFAQFKTDAKAYAEFQNALHGPQNAQQRPAYNSDIDDYYDDEQVTTITYGDSHKTYTFPIYGETGDKYLRNLVIYESLSGETTSYLLSYDFDANDLDKLQHGEQIANLSEKYTAMNTGNNDGYIRHDDNGNCYEVTFYDADGNYVGDKGQHYEHQVPCPQANDSNNVTVSPGSGGGGGGGASPLPIIIYYPTSPGAPSGPVSNPGGPGGSIGKFIPIITKPVYAPVSFLKMFYRNMEINDILDPERGRKAWLDREENEDIKDGIEDLFMGPILEQYDQRKDFAYALIDWLRQNEGNEDIRKGAEDMLHFLKESGSSENLDFAQEMIDIMIDSGDIGKEEVDALNMALVAQSNGYLTTPFDRSYYILIDPYTELDLQSSTNWLVWEAYFSAHCAILRSQNPEWSTARIYWEASKEMIHLGLDLIGLVPVVGEVADLANGIIYTIEGDGINATLSFASTIPVAGWAAAGVKIAKRSDKLKFFIEAADNAVTFGERNSKKFRTFCGLITGDARHAHHIISRGSAITKHEVVQKATQAFTGEGFHIDSALNGIAVAAWRNQPNHNAYDNKILQKLIDYNAANPNATPAECYNKLMEIIGQAKSAIINNPNVHLNDLIF